MIVTHALSLGGAQFSQHCRLMICDEGVYQLIEPVPRHYIIEIIERQIDAVIGNAPLRKVVRPDALRTIA
jgi:hypothetical protein